MAENLIAVWLDLECASGNDARSTESEIRVGAKILPFLIAGSDLICSGMGSILKYDNSFNPSLINGEEMEDYLVLQRDFEADGGLTPLPEETRHRSCASRAVEAIAAVFEELGLSHADRGHEASVVYASGSDETRSLTPRDDHVHQRGHQGARHHRDRCDQGAGASAAFREEAENLLNVVKLRLSGDYLQTSAMIRNGRIVSAVNDPNDLSRPRHRLPRVRGAPP